MHNYLDSVKLPQIQKKPSKPNVVGKKGREATQTVNYDNMVTSYDRSYGIQKIFDLHEKKEYKPETLFIAAGILDRYIKMVGPTNFPKKQMINLATISVLLSAKLE